MRKLRIAFVVATHTLWSARNRSILGNDRIDENTIVQTIVSQFWLQVSVL